MDAASLSRCPSARLDIDIKASLAHEPDYRHAIRLVFPRFVRARRLRLVLDKDATTLLHELIATLPAWPLTMVEHVSTAFRGRFIGETAVAMKAHEHP